MKKTILIVMAIAIIALSLTACDDGNGTTHTHTYAAAWTHDATQHWHECTANDGAKTDIAPHQWQWEETTPATTQAPGLETETCATCGAASGNTRPIAQLPDPNPKDQSKTITFGADITTTVTGHMTDTQWDNVIAKLTTALNAAANDSGDVGTWCSALFEVGFNIDLVTTQEYSYKIDVAELKFLLNADYVIGATQADLSAKIIVVIKASVGLEPITDGQQPQPCACLTTHGATAHLGIDAQGNIAPCTCGGNPCNCTEQTATVNGTTIPIRKIATVTVQQMNDTVANINTGYGYLSDYEKGIMAGKITEIHITTGNVVNLVGTILNVGFEADDEAIAEYIVLMP